MSTAAETPLPVPPIRMAQAMRVARRIYVRHLWQVVLLYAVLMAVPTAVNVPISVHFFAAHSGDEFVKQMEPGGVNYLPFAFNGMLTALLYPFAATATILLLRNVIVSRHARFRRSLIETLRLWLTITQFGLLWYIVLRIGGQIFYALLPMLDAPTPLHVALRVVAVTLAFAVVGWWFFAYVAGLVKIAVDRCDPARAALAGSRLALRHMRGFFAIAWRVTLVYALYVFGVALFAASKDALAAVLVVIVPSIVVTPFLVMALGLYLLDRLYHEELAEAFLRRTFEASQGQPPT